MSILLVGLGHTRTDWLLQKNNNRSRDDDMVTMTLKPDCLGGVFAQESHLFLKHAVRSDFSE